MKLFISQHANQALYTHLFTLTDIDQKFLDYPLELIENVLLQLNGHKDTFNLSPDELLCVEDWAHTLLDFYIDMEDVQMIGEMVLLQARIEAAKYCTTKPQKSYLGVALRNTVKKVG